MNNNRWGNVSRLRDIPAGEGVEMRYLSGPDATIRFGVKHAGGVTEVTMR